MELVDTMIDPSQPEELILRRDPSSGLIAAICIHSTALGPAAGGVRRWRYTSESAGVADAIRLAQGMTYKNALAEIPFGGGKSVILADDQSVPTSQQLAAFGRWLNELDGRYITAEDVGMGTREITELSRHSRHVSGVGSTGIGGDPSPKTAYGVFLGIKEAVRLALGRTDLCGVRVAVQGLGNVGMSLCHLLARAGAVLLVADVNAGRVRQAEHRYEATGVTVEKITRVDADVFAPCALGLAVDHSFAETTQVRVVAGAANNQLASPELGDVLAERGVLYAPDFVINAGGVISVAFEHLVASDRMQDSEEDWVNLRIANIPERLAQIVRRARESGRSTDLEARLWALQKTQANAAERAA